MTCVAGYQDGNGVYLCADTMAVDRNTLRRINRNDKKVFSITDFIIGFSGSYRAGQVLATSFLPPKHDRAVPDFQYMVQHFLEEMKRVLREHCTVTHVSGVDSTYQFLVGYRSRLYQIESDFQVCEPDVQYTAIGCGADVAIGSIYTSLKLGVEDPKLILTNALEASSEFNAGVGKKLTFMSKESIK